jgi:hypothetical protein
MAVSVAPLTTTVMGSVARERAGVASGINNAVSRTAGLLAVAALGIVMLHAFGSSLNRRLDALDVSAQARSSLDAQRVRLAGAEIPGSLDSRTQTQLKQAVAESFVHGFRILMLIAAALALLGALAALVLIEGKAVPRSLAGQAAPA